MKKNRTFNIDKNYLPYFFSVPGVSQIIEIFDKEKIEIQFVGGCVRDALMEKKIFDIDFSINCDPTRTVKVLSQNNIVVLEYGKKYGTITAVIQKNKFEITSLREDQNQSGRYTDIIYTNDWSKDARRRDFTFNAMYMSPFGKITDYFFGKNDIHLQTVRFIGDIEKRIQEDYLRVEAIRKVIGEQFPLMVDLNAGYNLLEARQAAQLWKSLNITWLEEPLNPNHHEAMGDFRSLSEIPIASGENEFKTYGFKRLFDHRAIDVAMPDIGRVGGLMETKNICSLAETCGIPISPHNFSSGVLLAATAHLMFAVSNTQLLEIDTSDNAVYHEFFPEPFQIKDGFAFPSDRPGLGVELSQEILELYCEN